MQKLSLIGGVDFGALRTDANLAVVLFQVGEQTVLRGGVAHPEVLRLFNEELEQLQMPGRPTVLAGGRVVFAGSSSSFGVGNSIGNDVPKDRQQIIEFLQARLPNVEIVELMTG